MPTDQHSHAGPGHGQKHGHGRGHGHGHGHGGRRGVMTGRSIPYYDRLARWVLPRLYRRIAADVDPLAVDRGRVLDVGTGPGVLVRALARRRPDLQLVGLDPSPDMIEVAERNLAPFGERAQATLAGVTAVPFPDDDFDLVVSSISLHHWERVDLAGPELARVVRPGGRVVVYDFRFAPFDELIEAWPGTTIQRSAFRTGIPFMRYERLILRAPETR